MLKERAREKKALSSTSWPLGGRRLALLSCAGAFPGLGGRFFIKASFELLQQGLPDVRCQEGEVGVLVIGPAMVEHVLHGGA